MQLMLRWHAIKTVNMFQMNLSYIKIYETFRVVDLQDLRKLGLSCLTAGPLISSVNCHISCRCGFYRHIPFLKSLPFMTIFINFAWDNLSSLWGDRKIISGVQFDASAPSHMHICTRTETHPHVYIYTMTCVAHSLSSFCLLIRDGPSPLSDENDSDSPRRQRRGRRVLNEFTDDESLRSGQSVFTAQSLNRAGLSIRPRSIWLGDSQQQIGEYKGQGGQLIRPLGH